MSGIRRVYPRRYYDAPIIYRRMPADNYFHSRMYNYSEGGIYFESSKPLKVGSVIDIVMVNYSPGSYGPEAFKYYIARVKWHHEIDKRYEASFGAGAQFLSRSHEVQTNEMSDVRFTCDICGKLTIVANMNTTAKSGSLCPECYKHFESITAGSVKDAIERFIIGNVI